MKNQTASTPASATTTLTATMDLATPRFLSASAARTTAFSSARFSRRRPVCRANGANSSHSAIGMLLAADLVAQAVSPTKACEAICCRSSTAVKGPWSILSLLTT